MARKNLILPKIESTQRDLHLDSRIDTLAEEHKGTYLIVANNTKRHKGHSHNRFYLHKQNALIFADTMCIQACSRKGVENATWYVQSDHPDCKIFIDAISSKVKLNTTREQVARLFRGLNVLLALLKISDMLPEHPKDINQIHHKHLSDVIRDGKLKSSQRIDIGRTWSFICINFHKKNMLFGLPRDVSVKTKINRLVNTAEEHDSNEVVDNSNEVTLEILFQLDYYSQIEMQRFMSRSKEYQGWIRELQEHEDLFSQPNILKTYYKNLSWDNLRKLHIKLYNEDPFIWIPKASKKRTINGVVHYFKTYPSEAAEKRHHELLSIAENGIDISIKDEKMFAWWHHTLFPDYPFNTKIPKNYDGIIKNWKAWRNGNTRELGISSDDIDSRIYPTIHTAYTMLLRLLIDTTANPDTIYNCTVYKKGTGTYDMGTHHHRLRMLNAIKNKSNTQPPAFVHHGTFTDQCITFFTDFARNIYDRSGSNRFLQYVEKGKIFHIDTNQVSKLNPLNTDNLKSKNSRGRRFFESYEIYKTVEHHTNTENKIDQIEQSKRRVHWVKPGTIRAACNFRDYQIGFGEWKRAHADLGHQDDETERTNYRKFSWHLSDQHEIANRLLHIQHFIQGKIIDHKLEQAFAQPHCYCTDNTHPDYPDAPNIHNGEVCTGWRKCLTECSKSNVFPEIHAPTIMAWKMLMEQEQENFVRTEDWYKEYASDYDAANVVIEHIPESLMTKIKETAHERIPFVRLMMSQTKRKRKINQNPAKVSS